MHNIMPPRVLMVCIMYVLLVPPELCDCSEYSPIQTTEVFQKPVHISYHCTLQFELVMIYSTSMRLSDPFII